MSRDFSSVPPSLGETDSTQHVVRTAPTGMRPLAQPSTPEMTGRIYLQDSPQAPLAGTPAAFAEDGAQTAASTVSFSMLANETREDPNVSASVGYHLGREIARGGMGKIFAAQDSALERTVALKISFLRGEHAGEQFLREARVLAHLAHPNIVPIHNMGADSQGRPFYSMKLVNGRTLHFILRRLLAGDVEMRAAFHVPALLSIFRKVCDAVAFAHSKGFLHRDLKPDNIMVGEFGEVLVMDWGLAKTIRGKHVEGWAPGGAEEEPETLPYVEGTPQYMSPEQAEGMYGGLDERSDVYSLGGILHAILTLRPPFTGASVEDVLRQVREGGVTTLTAPGADMERGAASPLGVGVPDALRAVTLKAMARERGGRYQSVAALVSDIDAYQGGFATSAEGANLVRLGVLFVKRHRVASIAALLLSVGALVFTLRLAQSERAAQANAVRAEREALAADASAGEARIQAQRASENARRAEHQAQLAALSEKAALAEKAAARRSDAEARIALAEAAENATHPEGMESALAGVPADQRDQQWRYLKSRLDSSRRTIQVPRGKGWRECVAHPTQPGVLITLQEDNWIRSLNLHSGESKDLIKLQGNFIDSSFGVSGDGRQVAVVRSVAPMPQGGTDEVQVYDLGSGKPKAAFQVPAAGQPAVLKFNSDGRYLLSVLRNTGVALYEISTGTKLWERSKLQFDGEFSAPAEVLQLASKNLRELVNARTGETTQAVEIQSPPQPRAYFSQSALFFTTHNTVRRLDPNLRLLYEFKVPDKLMGVELLPTDKLLVDLWQESEHSAALEVRDALSGALIGWNPVRIDRSYRSRLNDWRLVVHPGSHQVCVFRGGTMKVWDVGRVNAPRIVEEKGTRLGHSPARAGVAFLGKAGSLLHLASTDTAQMSLDQLQLEPAGGRTVKTLVNIAPSEGLDLSSNRDSSVIAALAKKPGDKFTLTLYRARNGVLEEVSSKPFPGRANLSGNGYLPSPSGEKVWSFEGFYSTADGTLLRALDRLRIEPLRFGADVYFGWTDDSHVVELSTHYDENDMPSRALILWGVGEPHILKKSVTNARSLCVSADGLRLAEGGSDGKLRIRSAQTLEVERTLRVQDAAVTGVAWHPTLPYVATSSEDLSLRIWDIESGETVQEYRYLPAPASYLNWSPDGQVLLFCMGERPHFLRPRLYPTVP